MNDLVKYHNQLNALEFKKFTAVDYDFLMYLCAQLKDHGTNTMTFSLYEIRQVTGYDYHAPQAEFIARLRKMNKKLMEIQASVDEDGKGIDFVLFPTFITDPSSNTLTVDVNPRFKHILNELTANFTQFELQEFTELSSKYSKSLYRLLKQYRFTGEYHVKIAELRKLLGCPDTYENKMFMARVIAPAIKELQKDFPLLKCEPMRARTKGRPITGYHFTFEADGQIPGQTTIDQAAEEMKRYKEQKDKEKKDKEKKTKKNSFTDFQQREIDYDALERSLIQNEINLVERGKEHEKITVHGELSD